VGTPDERKLTRRVADLLKPGAHPSFFEGWDSRVVSFSGFSSACTNDVAPTHSQKTRMSRCDGYHVGDLTKTWTMLMCVVDKVLTP
jgi:hypothetical protein